MKSPTAQEMRDAAKVTRYFSELSKEITPWWYRWLTAGQSFDDVTEALERCAWAEENKEPW